MTSKALFALVFLSFSTAAAAQDGTQKFATLGRFDLENGQAILDCRLGYRTFGRANPDRSNVVVMSTWFTGTTADLVELIGPGKLVDSSKYFVIAIDALGNGVSSSPSNSTAQPRMTFPRFSMRDIVNTQHELLTRVLHISHVRAVVGSSMAGMQVFEWIVSYPDFADRAVAIGGSPRLAPYDLLLWQTQRDAITSDPGWHDGDYLTQPGTTMVGEIANLIDIPPDEFNETHKREDVAAVIADTAKAIARFDANDHIRQSEAMTAHDVSTRFGGSIERAAAAVKAKVLVIVSRNERVVTPGPATLFGRLIHADVMELHNTCGLALSHCDREKIDRAVAEFLDR